jgi:hypothetical protein
MLNRVKITITKMPFYSQECIIRENTMNIKMLKIALAGLILSVNGFANAGLINFVNNGSFETTSNEINIANITNYPAGTASIPTTLADLGSGEWGVFSALPGWNTINSAGVEVQYNGNGGRNAADGNLFVSLDTSIENGDTSNGGIFQDITGLIIGEEYDFSLAYMGTSNVGYSNDFNISIGSILGVSFIGVLEDTEWSTWNYKFIAQDTNLRLRFSSAGAAEGNGALIDKIAITGQSVDVPEPSTLAIFALGIMGLASRRFKKQ